MVNASKKLPAFFPCLMGSRHRDTSNFLFKMPDHGCPARVIGVSQAHSYTVSSSFPSDGASWTYLPDRDAQAETRTATRKTLCLSCADS